MAEKQYEVLTPVKTFTGRRYGVLFEKGKGMATERQARVLVNNWGYSCPELKAKAESENSKIIVPPVPPVLPVPPAGPGAGAKNSTGK